MTTAGGRPSHSAISVGRARIPVTRGMLSGGLLVLLGIWGGLVPFVGPKFGYAYTPDTGWTWTWGRFWLEVIPAIAVVLGGLGLARARTHTTGMVSGWLASVGGAWFILGPVLSTLWTGGPSAAGDPVSATTAGRVLQEIGFFSGLGVVVLFLGAVALGRFAVAAQPKPREPRA
ncbi:hypothetical protein [Amycolatopsis taiwanensis]|nr:hypothetical protein [Amycolatopsis taiwanensis]